MTGNVTGAVTGGHQLAPSSNGDLHHLRELPIMRIITDRCTEEETETERTQYIGALITMAPYPHGFKKLKLESVYDNSLF